MERQKLKLIGTGIHFEDGTLAIRLTPEQTVLGAEIVHAYNKEFFPAQEEESDKGKRLRKRLEEVLNEELEYPYNLLAIKRIDLGFCNTFDECGLWSAFSWKDAPERGSFWMNVSDKNYPPIPEDSLREIGLIQVNGEYHKID